MTMPGLQGDSSAELPIVAMNDPQHAPVPREKPRTHLSTFRSPESRSSQLWFAAAAVILTVVYFLMLHAFWAPASPMIDQNAYEMGGRRFAQSFTTGVKPVNDFVYVSMMYVRAPDGTYYPKYPLGLSILYACALWMGQWTGVRHGGMEWAFLVAPLSAAASTLGLYLFLRRIASGFASVLGALLLSFSPLALVLVNQHWSHHPAMAVAIWGMAFLLAWWQKNGWWRGLIAGLLLGFAVLVRYTEGLLLLPLVFVVLNKLPYRARGQVPWPLFTIWSVVAGVAAAASLAWPTQRAAFLWIAAASAAAIFTAIVLILRRVAPPKVTLGWPAFVLAVAMLVVCGTAGSPALPLPHVSNAAAAILVKVIIACGVLLLFTVQWKSWRTLIQVSWPVVGWLVPVLYLVIFNKMKMGSWTGYDATNESTGFTFQQLSENWEYIFKQLNGTVIFFYMPVAFLGLGMVFRRNWRLGALLALWLVPNLITYGCYYWGVNLPAAILPILFYFRFFLTCLPPMAVCVALLIDDLLQRDRRPTEAVSPRGRQVRAVAVVASVGLVVSVVVHLLQPALRTEVVALIGVLAALLAATLFEVGRGVAAPLAAGALVAFAAGVSLYDNRGALDRDFVVNANLFDVGQNIVDRLSAADMKKSPVLFSEEWSAINHLQFAGNFECYTKDVFKPRVGRRPVRSDPNSPDPEQSARQEFTAGVYKDKTAADLVKMQNDVMSGALRDGRRVFVVLSPLGVDQFIQTFVTPSVFQVKARWKWREPAQMSAEGRKALMNFGLAGAMFFGNGTPQDWVMAEITLK